MGDGTSAGHFRACRRGDMWVSAQECTKRGTRGCLAARRARVLKALDSFTILVRPSASTAHIRTRPMDPSDVPPWLPSCGPVRRVSTRAPAAACSSHHTHMPFPSYTLIHMHHTQPSPSGGPVRRVSARAPAATCAGHVLQRHVVAGARRRVYRMRQVG